METNLENHITLNTAATSLILSCPPGESARILHWGERLEHLNIDALNLLTTRQHMHGGTDIPLQPTLLNELGAGVEATGFKAHHGDGTGWATLFAVEQVTRVSDDHVEISTIDRAAHIRAEHILTVHPAANVIMVFTRITNIGQEPLHLMACPAACLPVDPRATHLRGITGRWAGEFTMETIPDFTGTYLRENKAGRTSHASYPALIMAHPNTTETTGHAFGAHLGWSGNHSLRVDRLIDNSTVLQMGEYLFPGEIILRPDEAYESPALHTSFSSEGLNALSQNFHTHVREHILPKGKDRRPRPIHYNTWEAVYFDHDPDKLCALAEKAAEIGAERFVLDDGWFGARRNDRAGLGDWHVSEDIYPEGLTPLIEKVKSLDMEFGLWFEPEMVNPDSDLFRAHPDWILQVEGLTQPPSRGQYALDLTRQDVCDHLYGRLDALLSENDIAYIKWDMNRDIHHPGSAGRAAISKQTRALYALLARLRAAHPKLEIETCSSGGARADYGVLAHADRVWTSDTNDALDRQAIQRIASHFLPLDVTGAHVGPRTCHITGRRHSMEFRAGTAFFGHMGLELNLFEETSEDLEILKAGLALHKQHRALLHSGDLVRLDTPAHANAFGIVSRAADQALYSWAKLAGSPHTHPGRLYFVGLAPDRQYTTRIIWPRPLRSITAPSIIEAAKLHEDGSIFSGESLMKIGLQLPAVHPETCLIFYLQSI